MNLLGAEARLPAPERSDGGQVGIPLRVLPATCPIRRPRLSNLTIDLSYLVTALIPSTTLHLSLVAFLRASGARWDPRGRHPLYLRIH